MQSQIFAYLVINRLLLIIISLSASCALARPTINLATPENAFIQDISTQVLKKAYDKLGYELIIHKLPNVRSLLSTSQGDYDGEVSRIAHLSSKYPSLKPVPTPVNVINIIALGQQGEDQIREIQELKEDVLCVRGIKLVEKLVDDYNLNCSFVVNVDQALIMLNLGRANYAILPETNARAGLLKLALPNVKIVSPILHSEQLFHYLHEKNLTLIAPLDKVLKDMQTRGEISQIRSDYFAKQLQ